MNEKRFQDRKVMVYDPNGALILVMGKKKRNNEIICYSAASECLQKVLFSLDEFLETQHKCSPSDNNGRNSFAARDPSVSRSGRNKKIWIDWVSDLHPAPLRKKRACLRDRISTPHFPPRTNYTEMLQNGQSRSSRMTGEEGFIKKKSWGIKVGEKGVKPLNFCGC